eukprot:CAMPEP_0174382304 /NCGR_PEP_ID=MMETSP0811_2-20130205/124522_1 /TAXON_ID=73025 ORGANISM="Eutreptiella gymnastica-like, Strain CCMP1594" /NCGR_SAMPLE_ID=MMETSP0811_2 /ASSEMBLY_ACC=CAM_ASM_000667 /LENGTH=77 /DNA_ID=CAMNT_0015535595 /DNA_START=393 /DNA_END=626 /DNA_ORIENTATION=+
MYATKYPGAKLGCMPNPLGLGISQISKTQLVIANMCKPECIRVEAGRNSGKVEVVSDYTRLCKDKSRRSGSGKEQGK